MCESVHRSVSPCPQGYRVKLGLLLLLLGTAIPAAAQQGTAIAERPKRTILVEWATDRFDSELPFRESFNLRGSVGDNVDSVRFSYRPYEDGQGRAQGGGTMWRRSPILREKEFLVPVLSLEPNVRYRFRFVFYHSRSAPSPVTHHLLGVESRNDTLRVALRPLPPPPANPPAGPLVDSVDVPARANAGIQHHFDADFGLMYAAEAEYWGVLTNAHLHAVPVNRNEYAEGLTSLEQFARRASVFVGLAVQQITSEAEVKDMFAVGSPVVGVGYRGLLGVDPMRVTTGVVFFKQDDANPLVARDRTKRDVFVALTADIALQNIVAPLAALLR